ncbi:MAG TPA: dicarboxylate/amino acid:cation symporter [Thermoanaerobaculia bacterium]|nr:dicarboxylate/amino acid:cation symporter [Thermoanaerobaculia bacterium]
MNARTSNFILVGIVVGIVAAFAAVALFGEAMIAVEWMGTLFLRALKMIIVPLIMASMIVGITGLGDVRRLGRVGGLTVLYYGLTTGLAVALGIVMVNLLQPGVGIDLGTTTTPEEVMGKEDLGFADIILSFVSDNVFRSMAEMDILPVIVFSLVLGAVLTTIGRAGEPVIGFFFGLNEAIMKIVHLIMLFAPLGVFGLVAGRFARAGNLEALVGGLGRYMLTVILGLAVHALVVLPLILWTVGRRNPLRYLVNMGTPLLTAFSTASSSATLPLTIEATEEKNHVSRESAYFVLPLGATVNMDGTALYESVAAIFIAQAVGVDLTATQQVMIFLTATLAAIGAAGIPQAGLVTMVIVLRAVGLPLEGIGLILAVDWLLDRFRTAVNVWGDACGAGVIDRFVRRLPTAPPDLTSTAAPPT